MNVRAVSETESAEIVRIAHGVMRRYPWMNASLELDDLINAGYVGTLEARRRAPAHTPPLAYLAVCARGRMLDAMQSLDPLKPHQRRQVRREATVTRVAPAGDRRNAAVDGRSAPTTAPRAPRRGVIDPRAVSDVENAMISAGIVDESWRQLECLGDLPRLRSAIARLPARERTVINAIYFDDAPLDSVARALGVSVGRVSQLKSSAVAMLRASFEPTGRA